MPVVDPKLFSVDGSSFRFWLHPALTNRKALSRLIELHGGQIDDNEESTDFALVSTAADSALSVKRYGELIDAQNIVVDPSWVLDSVENGILMNEEDYMIFETETNDSHLLSAPLPLPEGSSDAENPINPEEAQKEENEFLLQAVVRFHAKEWLDIYTWCAENHPEHRSVDHWRSLNSPGYFLHAIAYSLRRDLREAPKNDLMDYEEALHAARLSFPSRNESLRTDHPARPSVGSRGGKTQGTYTGKESMVLKSIILEERDKPGFEPNRKYWWVPFEDRLPSRDALSMLKKFIISKELKSLARISFPAKANPNDDVSINADSASDEGDVEETAGDSKVLPTTVKGAYSEEEIATMRDLIINERDQSDFHPRGVDWWRRFQHLFPGRGAWGLYSRYHSDPALVALVPEEHRRRSKHAALARPKLLSRAIHEDSESESEHENNSDDDISAPESNKPLSGAQTRITWWAYTPQEIDTMRSIILAQRERPDFNPYSESWWVKFKSQFPDRSPDGIARKFKRLEELTALCPSQETLNSYSIVRKRKRASGVSQGDHDTSEIGTETDHSDYGEVDLNDEDNETALISTLVYLKGDAVRAAWSVGDIEHLLAAVDRENFTLPTEKLHELSRKYGKTIGNWRTKFARNKPIIRRILDLREDTTGSPSNSRLPLASQDPPKKKTRLTLEPEEIRAARSLITPAPSASSSSIPDSDEERLALRKATSWFLDAIPNQKPTTDLQMLDIWTSVSEAHGQQLSSLMRLYYTNLDVFQFLLERC